MAPKAIHDHTLICAPWKERVGAPWPKFKFSARKEHYVAAAVEGVDYVQCKICMAHGWDFRFSRLMDHIGMHGLTEAEYSVAYPDAKVRLPATYERRKNTVKERYGCDNVFQSEEVKSKISETNMSKYGRGTPRGALSVEEKSFQRV